MTDHQMTVISFLLGIVVAAVPACLWLNRKLDLIGKKRVRHDLDSIIKLGEQRYAERQTQKMRTCFGIGGYLLCCSFAMPRTAIWFLNALLPISAALFFAVGSGYSQVSTIYGVEEIAKRHRLRLGLPDEPARKIAKRAAGGEG